MYRIRFVGDDAVTLSGYLCHQPDDVFAGQYGNTSHTAEAAPFTTEADARAALDSVRRLFAPDQVFLLEAKGADGWTPIEDLP